MVLFHYHWQTIGYNEFSYSFRTLSLVQTENFSIKWPTQALEKPSDKLYKISVIYDILLNDRTSWRANGLAGSDSKVHVLRHTSQVLYLSFN